MFCSRCGDAIPESATFCPTCGQQTQPATPAVGLSPQAPGGVAGPLAPQETSGLAIASLLFGILFIFPLSIPAIIFGHVALSQIKKSAGRLRGRGLAIAGLVLGYLGLAAIPLILIIAAIAIPNLLRARIAANEASAVQGIRQIDTAQMTYQRAYPGNGYARDLSSLGGAKPCSSGPATACLIGNELALATAPPGSHGYIFFLTTAEDGTQYVVTAVPVNWNRTGVRSFCSTEDGVVRSGRIRGAIPLHDACARLHPLTE